MAFEDRIEGDSAEADVRLDSNERESQKHSREEKSDQPEHGSASPNPKRRRIISSSSSLSMSDHDSLVGVEPRSADREANSERAPFAEPVLPEVVIREDLVLRNRQVRASSTTIRRRPSSTRRASNTSVEQREKELFLSTVAELSTSLKEFFEKLVRMHDLYEVLVARGTKDIVGAGRLEIYLTHCNDLYNNLEAAVEYSKSLKRFSIEELKWVIKSLKNGTRLLSVIMILEEKFSSYKNSPWILTKEEQQLMFAARRIFELLGCFVFNDHTERENLAWFALSPVTAGYKKIEMLFGKDVPCLKDVHLETGGFIKIRLTREIMDNRKRLVFEKAKKAADNVFPIDNETLILDEPILNSAVTQSLGHLAETGTNPSTAVVSEMDVGSGI